MIKGLASLVLVLSAPAMLWAETFSNSEFGYSIDIADGYQLARNDSTTVFRSEQDDGFILIKNWPGLDAETAKAYLQQGYQDARIAVVPDGDMKEASVDQGKGFLTELKGVYERQGIKGLAGGFVGDSGQGMVVVFAGPDENWDKLAPVARQLAASVKFIEFKPAPVARDWYSRLADTRLSFRGDVDDGKRVRERLDLCSDGYFFHRISSSAVRESGTGSAFGHSAKSRTGEWRVVDDDGTSRLVLRYRDGRDESAVIESRDGEVYIDGRHYTQRRATGCR